MTQRKEVFQSKVLGKLYPSAPKVENNSSPPCIVEAFARKKHLKRKPSQCDNRDAGMRQHAANRGKRIYTVLPPPADYKSESGRCVTFPQLEDINNTEDPAEESVHKCSEEPDQGEDAEEPKKRRRRRRKTRAALGDGTSPVTEAGTGQSETSASEGGQHISRNKKRKLKKKRHKEKLLAVGLVPRASALEFTYKKEVEDVQGAAELSEFLQTTMEIYMSDSSLPGQNIPRQRVVMEQLLSSIAAGVRPAPLLKQLYSLKTFVQQKDTDSVVAALEDLSQPHLMSAEETSVVASLFQYWITDILPMQGHKTTEVSTTHPQAHD